VVKEVRDLREYFGLYFWGGIWWYTMLLINKQ
jgi:hypothetical protein